MIDFQPNEEEALIVETVRQFAENEIRPRARECDEAGALDSGVLEQAHELGLVTGALPEAFGGGGERSAVTGCLITEELAWGDLSLALGVLSPSLLGLAVLDGGTEEQRAALLPGLTGDAYRPGSLALVEPRFDFDAFRPATVAKRDGGDFLLDGQKCFVPWQDGLSHVLVVASEESGGVQVFVVPTDADGLSATPEQNLGLRALPTVELGLSGVRVPATARLGGDAGSDVRALVNRGRVALAAAAVGLARATFEVSRDYAKERHAFGVPIATKQAIAFKLADMATEIDGARLLAWEAAWKLDRGEDATREATLARDKAARVALDCADGAVQVFGGHGYIRDYLPEMHLRNARGFSTFEALALV
ncbi:MAG: acyl-CoA dehydrogenase family protein [Myxococcota bacterium]